MSELYVEPDYPPIDGERRDRRSRAWHSRWAVIAAFQTGIILALVCRHDDRDERPPPANDAAPPVAQLMPPPLELGSNSVAPPATSPIAPKPPPSIRPAVPRTTAPRTAVLAPAPAPTPPLPTPPANALVEVDIESNPEGARVKIADTTWGVTPLTALLPPRSTTIVLELAGHAPQTLTWSPRSGPRIRATLRPEE